jgi:hypothetical protein
MYTVGQIMVDIVTGFCRIRVHGPSMVAWGQPRRFSSIELVNTNSQNLIIPMFATNSDRGGLTDVKSIALPQLYNADSAAAVEVEAKRSAMRPYPTGRRG